MQKTDLGADECLDPALMTACAYDPFCALALADAGPPSPFDMSTIDPDLLALYPDQNGGVDVPAASPPLVPVEPAERSPSPTLQEETHAIPTTHVTSSGALDHGQSPPAKRVRLALPFASSSSPPVTRTQSQKRSHSVSGPAPKKHSALGVAKRTISDGTLVPPAGPCARCDREEAECRVKYPGAACNACRRRGRKCELVDERGKFNGQRAKDLRAAEAASGSGSGCVWPASGGEDFGVTARRS